MKNKLFVTLTALLAAGSLNAQISNGAFNGPTGFIQTSSAGAPWLKGCSYNSGVSISSWNHPEVKQNGGNNYVELTGDYNAYAGNPYINMESISQTITPLAAGEYTITFDARNTLQTSGNPGLQLIISLKNYMGCSWDPGAPSNQEQLAEYVSIPLVYNFNTYTANFCVPQYLHNQLNVVEFGAMHQFDNSISCDGVISLDNISLSSVTHPYDLGYDYEIDCLTGLVKVRPTSALSSDLYDMFFLVENNPNDPNNLSDAGDVTHEEIAWWGYNVDAQGWYTFSIPLDQGKNYYLKRGIWGDCMNWVELRKFNLELTPDQFNGNFSYSISCNEKLEPKLTVIGANQQGKNPYHMFILCQYFPGTNNPAQQIETINWWQQSNASNYQYQQGPFTFNHVLDPNAHYYVKRGVWDACTPWGETRQYNIVAPICDPNEICDMFITALQPPCFDACGSGKWLSEFQINPNSVCYNAIDYVVFNTVNNHPFGPTFIDYNAPYSVPYCTGGNYYVTATIHYLNGTTSTASYYQPACFGKTTAKSAGEEELISEEIHLYPNPATSVLNVDTDLEFDELDVYSIGGKLIGSFTENTIDISELENGYYLLKVLKGGIIVSTERFMKQ